MRHSPSCLSRFAPGNSTALPAIRASVRTTAGATQLSLAPERIPASDWIRLRINPGPTPLATHAGRHAHEIHLHLAHELFLSPQDHRAELPRLPAVVADPVAWEIANALLAASSSQRAVVPLTELLLASIPVPRSPAGAKREPGTLQPWQVQRLERALETGLARELSLAHLARECRLSVCHFSRAFKATYGVTAHQHVVACRIRHAQRRLANTGAPIAQVALECGFPDQSSFTRRFAAVTGSSPALWRRERTPAVRAFTPPPDRAALIPASGDLLCA